MRHGTCRGIPEKEERNLCRFPARRFGKAHHVCPVQSPQPTMLTSNCFCPCYLQSEWRSIGVQQSRGWVHYAIHRPEPHIMLFRRPLNYGQQAQPATTQAQAQPTAA